MPCEEEIELLPSGAREEEDDWPRVLRYNSNGAEKSEREVEIDKRQSLSHSIRDLQLCAKSSQVCSRGGGGVSRRHPHTGTHVPRWPPHRYYPIHAWHTELLTDVGSTEKFTRVQMTPQYTPIHPLTRTHMHTYTELLRTRRHGGGPTHTRAHVRTMPAPVLPIRSRARSHYAPHVHTPIPTPTHTHRAPDGCGGH